MFKGFNKRTKRSGDKAEQLTRTISLRIYPNFIQKSLLRQWMGCARLVYNMVVFFHRRGNRGTKSGSMSFFRAMLWHRINTSKEWAFVQSTPYDVLDAAIEEAIKNREEVKAKNRLFFTQGIGNGVHRLSFRRKKDDSNTISIRHQYCRSDLTFYTRFLHVKKATCDISETYYECLRQKGQSFTSPLKPQSKEHNPTRIFPGHPEHFPPKNHGWPNPEGLVGCDSTLTYNHKQRKFVFNWVYLKPKPSVPGRETQAAEIHLAPTTGNQREEEEKLHVCAIDPGVRAFLTFYSPSKGYGEIGGARPGSSPANTIPNRARRRKRNTGPSRQRPQKEVLTDADHIFRLGMFVDRLISKTARAPSHKRANMRRAIARARDRIKWLVREIHCKAAKFLVQEFDVILLPEFEGGRMSKRFGRKINSKTTRQMLGWSHYKFRQRLLHKAEELGKTVLHPNEAHTTKTCSVCGRINNRVGGSKVFHCRQSDGGCGHKSGRDLDASICILLSSLSQGQFTLVGDDE